jgi:hypothetical protein
MILRISAAFRMRTSLLLSTGHFACVATRPALLRGLACDRTRQVTLPAASDMSDALAPDITAEVSSRTRSTRLVWGSVRDLDRTPRWRLDAGDRVSALNVRSAQEGRKRQHYERSCWFCGRPAGLLLNDHALRHILPSACGYARLIRQLDGNQGHGSPPAEIRDF